MTPVAAAAQSPRSTPVPTPARQAPPSNPAPPPAAAPPPATARPARVASPSATVRPWNEQEYRLGAGDKLRVEVYGEPQLSQSLQVRPDGKITLPLVGDIVGIRAHVDRAARPIATSLKEYVNNPVVTVIVVEATAAQIYIIGEVASAGRAGDAGADDGAAGARPGRRPQGVRRPRRHPHPAQGQPGRRSPSRSTTRTRSEDGSSRSTCSRATRWSSRSRGRRPETRVEGTRHERDRNAAGGRRAVDRTRRCPTRAVAA